MSKEKTKKFRGSRTCGGGTHKNRRGGGSRGGAEMPEHASIILSAQCNAA